MKLDRWKTGKRSRCAAWGQRLPGSQRRSLEWTCLGLRALRVQLPLCPACELELELLKGGKAR